MENETIGMVYATACVPNPSPPHFDHCNQLYTCTPSPTSHASVNVMNINSWLNNSVVTAAVSYIQLKGVYMYMKCTDRPLYA